MKIAVASGKGGTGKTTVATSLALALSGTGTPISCLDCDVEAPNAHIFLQPDIRQRQPVNILIPEVDIEACTGCGRCAEVCQYHAIVVLGTKPFVFPQLCHGCGSCAALCPDKAITEIPKPMGMLESGTTKEGITFARGVLDVGEPMAVPVIRQLKKWQNLLAADVVVLDSPPGASCPVVETLKGADYVLLVTEPTPFGLHDLKLAVELTRELDIPCGVIVNRHGIGDDCVDEYCCSAGLPILMRIPFDREIGHAIARGKTLLDIHPEYSQRFQDLYRQVEAMVYTREGAK
jgi:MinD superfamily P-loop ATPase